MNGEINVQHRKDRHEDEIQSSAIDLDSRARGIPTSCRGRCIY